MSDAILAALARQEGLMREMQVVANNIANANTTGYKTDRALFAEFIAGGEKGSDGISMGSLAGHSFDLAPGELRVTGGQFDLAIQGEGFFLVQTPAGERLTRAGHFQLSSEGNLIDAAGNNVLDPAGNEIQIPEQITKVAIAADGTISGDGEIFGRLGVVTPEGELQQEGGTMFSAPEGYQPTEGGQLVQGALEQSNVSPILEISRMIEVQRAYEAGQALFDKEDERVSRFIETLRQL